MSILLIPAAGASTRFNFNRPKFLLQHPLGGTMLENSIAGLGNLKKQGIEKVLIISLAEYFKEISAEKLIDSLKERFLTPIELLLLNKPTSSMVDTVVKGIEFIDQEKAIIVKDCDNYVKLKEGSLDVDFNLISTVDISVFNNIRPDNKSFLSINETGMLLNIVEKKIISPHINIGCVKFLSSSDFISCAMEMKSTSEAFISDVIRLMLNRNNQFIALKADDYEDWGTQKDWLNYIGKFQTIFIDIDGVIANNENPLSLNGGWDHFVPINENCQFLLEIQNSEKSKIVFTTSRSGHYREILSKKLNDQGFKDYLLIMDLPHAKRILINDFAPTNPFPSAISINISRNSNNLKDFLI
jgi:hypothetical protein